MERWMEYRLNTDTILIKSPGAGIKHRESKEKA
jgi:hypothetical protein